MKRFTFSLIALAVTVSGWAQPELMNRVHKLDVRPADAGRNITSEIIQPVMPFQAAPLAGEGELNKISMMSSTNAYGIFNYEQRFVTLDQTSNLFTYGNRAGGVFGNTGNDLKFKFTTDHGETWDSALIASNGTKLFRYPSLIVFNPTNSSNPDDLFGIVSGPITETSWTDQFFGSIRLDGQHEDIHYEANPAGIYLNHMNIDLFCSPDGHVTVGSQRLNGTSSAYTFDGWEILNGTFNAAQNKFDWQLPFVKVNPALKEDGRIDASLIAWSPDGSIGYLMGTAIDADPAYNPYGVEWPVIFKTTDHGLTWTKEPAFDFSSMPIWETYLYPTRADLEKIIPRWYNKWASPDNQSTIGGTVDIHGNLHLLSVIRSTMSINPDSLNYFYSDETVLLFDVHMKPGGGWEAFLVDSLLTDNPQDTGPYGMGWDHQTQMSRNPDGSKVFMTWTDSDPNFGTENTTPDVKGMGYDAVTGKATPVKNFTAMTTYWMENFWLRLADEVFFDESAQTYTLPVTTSIMGPTVSDPLIHQYLTGVELAESDFSVLVGTREETNSVSASPVSGCFPNPCTDRAVIRLSLQKSANVSLQISSLTGNKVLSEEKGTLTAGNHGLAVNTSGFNPGIYFWTVTIDNKPYSGKMVVR